MPFPAISRADLVIKTAAWLSQVRTGDLTAPSTEVRHAWNELTSLEFEAVYRDAKAHANLLESGGLINAL
jgi:hypothetical protein